MIRWIAENSMVILYAHAIGLLVAFIIWFYDVCMLYDLEIGECQIQADSPNFFKHV